MSKCLFLTPFPLAAPKHGGQIRAASLRDSALLANWQVDSVGIYPSELFRTPERGPLDIVLDDKKLNETITSDLVFADLKAAQAAARSKPIVDRLRRLIQNLAPDVIQVEHPWTWLLLREALPSSPQFKIIYSSHNIEWAARKPLLNLGLKSATSQADLEATRLLEEDFARAADLVLSISDLEAKEIERVCGRPVVYLPAISELKLPDGGTSRFAAMAQEASCRYAALLGSAYWPNVEGFFDILPDGLGFLARDEQLWVAGNLGDAIVRDERFHVFLSINQSRTHIMGYIEESEKADFLTAAACVVVPVTFGAGAKMKTADAIASGRPVIATPHALEGYGPIVGPALGEGVYVADSPKEFRRLMREAFRTGLRGCSPEIRGRLSLEAMSKTWARHVGQLLESRELASPAVLTD
ncbi:glycosyltransferase [Chelatococcus sp. GCM10030263]|uniref:glycosyltransferase n=1 Tax=Chelatococcus sp. GCM10030263 TaxID=3273387 RepID=UPI003621F410